MRVVSIYRTEPDWSALVELDNGGKLTLTFPTEPTEEAVLAQAASLMAEPETLLEVEAENGQIIL